MESSSTTLDAGRTEGGRGGSGRQKSHRRSKGRRFRFLRRIPAPIVFYATAALTTASLVQIYRSGERFLWFAVAACLWSVVALVVNDGKGFYRSRRMRRAYEARRKFNNVEIVIVVGLMLANLWFLVPIIVKRYDLARLAGL